MMDTSATVYCRKKDKKIAQKAVESATKQYNEISGRKVKVQVVGELDDEGLVPSFLSLFFSSAHISLLDKRVLHFFDCDMMCC